MHRVHVTGHKMRQIINLASGLERCAVTLLNASQPTVGHLVGHRFLTLCANLECKSVIQ